MDSKSKAKSYDLFDIFRQKWKTLESGDGKYNSFKKGLEGLLKMELEDLAWEKTPIGKKPHCSER